ncbi:MAG: prepilin peptidase [Candidatus Doudnabacteria bacterium]|nr:prepilin peptidase [Candidatus Doudnabacteria bacterium]
MPIIFFISGLIIGSFLNAAIYRLWTGQGIVYERSICPHCKHVLSAWDLVPVFSYLFLGGRCRYCRKRISWQYPLIELVTATCFVLLAQNFQFSISNIQFWFQLVFICFFIVIAVFDLKHYLILDKILLPGSVLALIYAIYTHHLPQGLVGILIISGFFALQYFISKGRWIGFGDVKLGIFLGLIFGIGQGIILLFLSYLVGALVGVALIAADQKEMGSKLPFGTFLTFCGIIMLLYGKEILSFYLQLIGF